MEDGQQILSSILLNNSFTVNNLFDYKPTKPTGNNLRSVYYIQKIK